MVCHVVSVGGTHVNSTVVGDSAVAVKPPGTLVDSGFPEPVLEARLVPSLLIA